MKFRPIASLFILALVAACGGGGGDGTAISGTPPAPAPGPTPTPSPAPSPTPAPAPAVDGAVLASAFCKNTLARHGAPLVGASLVGFAYPDPQAFPVMTQQSCAEGPGDKLYLFGSSRYVGSSPDPFPNIGIRSPMTSASGPFAIGDTMQVSLLFDGMVIEEHPMVSDAGYSQPDAPPVPLGRTLRTWHATDAAKPGRVDLQVLDHATTDDHPDPMFKVCWNVVVPPWSRRSCQVYTRRDGLFVGVEVTDSSYVRGPVTWFGWWEGIPF